MKTEKAIELFIKSRESKNLSLETIAWYKRMLAVFSRANIELPENPELIEAFLASCKAGDEQRHGYFRVLRCMYKWLGRRVLPFGWINPVDMVDAPKRKKKGPRALTNEQLVQLISYPHESSIKAYMLFLVDTGCRIGELYHLKHEDLYETSWGYVARVDGKTGERIVPISRDVLTEVRQYIPVTKTLYRLRRLISNAFRQAGVKGSAHVLRHTFGTMFEGEELVLQQIMGHSNLSTTKRYREIRVAKMCGQHEQSTPFNVIIEACGSSIYSNRKIRPATESLVRG